MTKEQGKKKTKLLQNEMQREVKAIEKKYKTKILYILQI